MKKKSKSVKTKHKKVKTPSELFSEWWNKWAEKRVTKIEKEWLKDSEPNDPDDDGGGDSWYVNQMMHDGEAHNMTYDLSEPVFLKGYNNEDWKMSMGESLFCDLDSVIFEAYEAGKRARNEKV